MHPLLNPGPSLPTLFQPLAGYILLFLHHFITPLPFCFLLLEFALSPHPLILTLLFLVLSPLLPLSLSPVSFHGGAKTIPGWWPSKRVVLQTLIRVVQVHLPGFDSYLHHSLTSDRWLNLSSSIFFIYKMGMIEVTEAEMW